MFAGFLGTTELLNNSKTHLKYASMVIGLRPLPVSPFAGSEK